MKILDRYIISSIASAFLFGVAMFMALLMAMSLLPDLIKMIAEQGVAPGVALAILAYQLPGLLVYAFPMSILLCILLVFNRMSADSEMVAIRAGGISFLRIVLPAMIFALLITGLTYWLNGSFMPYAQERSAALRARAMEQAKSFVPINFVHVEDGEIKYSIIAANLNMGGQELRDPVFIFFSHGKPFILVYAPRAIWDRDAGRWEAKNTMVRYVDPTKPAWELNPTGQQANLTVSTDVLRVKESADDLSKLSQKPENLSTTQLRELLTRLRTIGGNELRTNKLSMELIRRYTVPFSCLVFALIGAPLGLRNHRTSSAVGLGVSLLLIIVYYFVANFLSLLGERGAMPQLLAGWLPNILGAVAGIGMMMKANK